MATLSQLTLDADGTVDTANIEHDAGTGSPYFSHCNDAPDGVSSDFVQNDDGETSGKARFRLTNVNADFGSMDTLTIEVDVLAVGFSNDSCTLTARIFDADDEVTPLTAETTNLADHNDAPRLQRTVSFGTFAGNKAQWDSAYIQFTWLYNKSGGPDNANLQLLGCALDGTYTAGVADVEVNLDLGTYTLAGQTIQILVDQEFNTDVGSYTVSGPTLSILVDREINLDLGTYSLTGNAIDITFSIEVNLDLGNYTLVGQDITILVDKEVNLDLGNYTLTGNDATFLIDREINLDLGNYTVTGNDVTFLIDREINLDEGNYDFVGHNCTITIEQQMQGGNGMAEKSVSAKRKGAWLTFEWLAVTETDTFQEIYLRDNVSDMVMEAEGTFGGATVTLKQWVVTEAASFAAVKPNDSPVSLGADGATPVRDAFPFMRPLHSGGSSETIDVRIHVKVVI